MFGGFGVPELILILIIGLVIFGPGKLPDIGKAFGKSIKAKNNIAFLIRVMIN